jgi:phospholipase D1/2
MNDSASPPSQVHREHPPQPRLPWPKWLAAGAVILALTLAWRLTPLAHVLTPEKVIAWTKALADYWWAPAVLMLAYTPASLVMFPRPLITLALVVAFGPWHGFFYAMGGILLAALVAYAAGRALDSERVRGITGDRLYRLAEVLRARGLLAVTAIRLVPLAPFAVESLFAGAIRIRVAHFLGGTFLGLSPGVLTATVFGDQLEAAVGDASRLNYALIGAVLVVLLAGTFAVRHWFARLEREHASRRL